MTRVRAATDPTTDPEASPGQHRRSLEISVRPDERVITPRAGAVRVAQVLS
jgi:hypothetical protein